MRALVFGLTLAVSTFLCSAQPLSEGSDAPKASAAQDLAPSQKTERGWFYFESNKKPEAEPEPESAPPTAAAPPEKKPVVDRCAKAKTWTAACGFVEPGMDFDFQAKQRDALLVQMSMSKNDPKAVEQFQYYMRWVVGRAGEVANMWAFNMVQNPELDPQAKQPISAFGVRMLTDVQQGKESEIFKVIKDEGGMLVFFTKSDCPYCHAMGPTLLSLANQIGIPVRNAALDATCLPAFTEGCLAGEAVQAPAQALQVTMVPAVFLYMKPNTWIRVANGITDSTTLRARLFSFFTAYRSAMLKGIDNAQKGRVSVDFSDNEVTGTAKGVDAPEGSRPPPPSEADISRLLGKK